MTRLLTATIAVRHLTGTGRVQELAQATLELEDAKREFDARCWACEGHGILLGDTGPAPTEDLCPDCDGTGNVDRDDLGMVYTVDEEVCGG